MAQQNGKCEVWKAFNHEVVLLLEDGTKFAVPKSALQEVAAEEFQVDPTFIIDEATIHPPTEAKLYVRVAQSSIDRIQAISQAKAAAKK